MSPFTTLGDVVLLPTQKQALEAYVENGESLYINSEFRDPEERVLEPRDAEKVRKGQMSTAFCLLRLGEQKAVY